MSSSCVCFCVSEWTFFRKELLFIKAAISFYRSNYTQLAGSVGQAQALQWSENDIQCTMKTLSMILKSFKRTNFFVSQFLASE
ncbi:hypothetical protein L596_017553 [Steinernema carpocapsae]|uniref:Uncharacterized protein n=1 Tax=Steinernema carpocapsae TaxID=34508 RepID=A0A4U5N2R4_STECR|nr:hypothetical protein L596_017553 [Steinernema carpocapsae]